MRQIIFLLIFFISQVASAQKFKDRFFASLGFTTLADVTMGPFLNVTFDKPAHTQSGPMETVKYTGVASGFNIGILSYTYGMRLNLLEKGPDFSLGLYSPITAALSVGSLNLVADGMEYSVNAGTYVSETIAMSGGGYGKLNFPLFLQASFGVGSTYSTGKVFGFTAGLGMDYRIAPLFHTKYDISGATNFQMDKFSKIPSVNIGFRKLKGDNLSEINLRIGYSGKQSFTGGGYNHESISTPGLSISLSYHGFFYY